MKIGLAQIGAIAGDFEGNVTRCLAVVREAASNGADLVVLPAMAVPGTMPRDLLFDPGFVDAAAEATADFARRLPPAGPTVVAGTVVRATDGLIKAAALLDSRRVVSVIGQCRPNPVDASPDARWFTPAPPSEVITVGEHRVGFIVDGDLWSTGADDAAPRLRRSGAEVLVCSAASPYRAGIEVERIDHAKAAGAPMVVVNACGAADERIFDGRSFVVSSGGRVVARLPHCAEAVQVVDTEATTAAPEPDLGWEDEVWTALVFGVRRFVEDNGLERIVLGLSGGVDSAVTTVLAAEAVGPDRVTTVAMPSRHTNPLSTESARDLAERLGIGFEVVDLEPLHRAAENALGDLVSEGVGAENLQARLRMIVLTAMVNRGGGLLLNTSNKTELSLGYGTLHGDLAGSLSPLGDVTKTGVYRLARWINRDHEVIPSFIINRPPSAELAPGQVDPFTYAALAPTLEALVQSDRSNDVLRHSEHKRGQHGVILQVSRRAFGPGRMIPITRR